MKKSLQISGITILILFILLLLLYFGYLIKWHWLSTKNLTLLHKEAPALVDRGYTYRDLNKNCQLDIYEDSRVSVEDRIEDLVSQMQLEEKAGLMFANFLAMEKDGDLLEIPSLLNYFSMITESTSTTILQKKINHVQNLEETSALTFAIWHNKLQKLAERTRLGIPVTVISNPKNKNKATPITHTKQEWASTWPSPLGFAATRDTNLVRAYGDIIRQEYLAKGIRIAQHPIANSALDVPEQSIGSTFGEDTTWATLLTKAYISGLQGDVISAHSIASQVKYYPKAKHQHDELDAQSIYSAGQLNRLNSFTNQLAPFKEGALKANATQVMAYNSGKQEINEGRGQHFDIATVKEIFRDSLNFGGVVATHWGALSATEGGGSDQASKKEQIKKALAAGYDLFCGEYCTNHVVELVEEGVITENRIDASVRRILRDKFRLGLFDNPYVDIKKIYISPAFVAKGREAQRKSLVLLKNEHNILPLSADKKIWIKGIEKEALLKKHPNVVANKEDADVIIQKLQTTTPSPLAHSVLEKIINYGKQCFEEHEYEEIIKHTHEKPTITIFNVQNHPVQAKINEASKAVIADFECEDDIILELIFGTFNPSGKLPLTISASINKDEENNIQDSPYNEVTPTLYPYGHGLTF